MNLDVVGPISGRLGRYPGGRRGAPTWHGMIADTNMPTELTPWHKFMENLPPNWQKFIQPSGLIAERGKFELAAANKRNNTTCRSIIQEGSNKEERTMTTSSKCTGKTIPGSTGMSKPNMVTIHQAWRFSKRLFGRHFHIVPKILTYTGVPTHYRSGFRS